MRYKKMFVRLIILNVIVFSLFAIGQENEMKLYGKEIKLKKITPLKNIYQTPGKYKGRNVLIEGTVESVCQTRGSLMEVSNGPYKIRVEFEDHSIFVPYDSKGKKVKIQGKVKHETSKETKYKRWLKEAGASKTHIKKIKGDQKVITMVATGVLMKGRSEISQKQLDVIEGKTENKD